MKRKLKLLLFVSLCLTGCGYQFGQGDLPAHYRTIEVPYPEGDRYGDLTSWLVREIAYTGAFEYRNECADLTLRVKLIDYYDENIGFRYDTDKKGKLTNSIIPTESRFSVLAEVTVVDNLRGCAVLGPSRIFAGVDFDHDYYSSTGGINVFSLGQLSDVEVARDDVHPVLYQALAKKIIDYVVNSW